MKKKRSKDLEEQQPSIAPGIDDDPELNQEATKQEIKAEEYTEVTTLAYDEVEPSQ